MQYKYLQIEDNPKAAESLDLLMSEYEDFIPTLNSCDLNEGIKAILTHKPDLIFLDVELPNFTGFDFLTKLRQHLQELPAIIMTTAHEKYALSAVNEEILYYIIKPLDPDELFKAINKFKIKKAREKKSILLKTNKGYTFLELKDIFLIQASSNYTYFFTLNLEKILVSKTLKDYEPYLSEEFLRVHKGHIINKNFIKTFNSSKKKIQLLIPGLKDIDKSNDFILPLLDNLNEDNLIEISIGDAYLNKVKNTVLYNKI